MEPETRNAADYETLRNYATEGGEAHDGAEVELAMFITHGAAAWIRPRWQSLSHVRSKMEGPLQDGGQRLLAILLANMMESRGVS